MSVKGYGMKKRPSLNVLLHRRVIVHLRLFQFQKAGKSTNYLSDLPKMLRYE